MEPNNNPLNENKINDFSPPTQNTENNTQNPPVVNSPSVNNAENRLGVNQTLQPSNLAASNVAYAQSTPSNNKKKILKISGIIIAVLILITGVGAGAYFGIYLPNTPQNVLNKSVVNLAKKEKISAKGNMSLSIKDSITVNSDYTAKFDRTNNASELTAESSFMGAKLSVDARYVQKNAYIKLGELSSVKKAVSSSFGEEASGYIDVVDKKLANKWIEIDEKYMKSNVDDKCAFLLDDYKLENNDIDQIIELYKKNEFVNISNVSKDTIDGKKVTKMDLNFDDSKIKSFGKSLESLDKFKKINECENGDVKKKVSEKEESSPKTDYKVSAWVNKNKKELLKIYIETKNDEGTFSIETNFNDDNVDIKKPDNTISVEEVAKALDLNIDASGQTTSKDAERESDIVSVHAQLEAYFAQYGQYPSLENLNNESWVKKNLANFKTDTLQDPDSTENKLSTNPGKNIYSYQAIPGGCTTNCKTYTLTATLSTGKTFTKRSLN